MTIYSQVSQNKFKTVVIIVFFVAFISTVGFLLGKAYSGEGTSWFVFALMFSLLASLGSYFYGDQLVLSMSGAHPASKKQDFDFYTVCENLAIASGLPMPKLYVIESEAINAFSTGRDPKHAAVCATRGLLERLNRREIEGVVAHEMSHVKNFDIRLMLIVSVLVGALAFISDWFMRSLWWGRRSRDNEERGGNLLLILGIVLALISPLIATLIQLAISRRREYLADATGALLTRYPAGLADALEEIGKDREVLKTASNGTAHLFIANPFKGKSFSTWFSSLFDTHPPLSERIRILRSM